MKIKKITASSMPEAMKQVRAELGSDAVILNSRVMQTGGILGFFRKNRIEVIAAVDPETAYSAKPDIPPKEWLEIPRQAPPADSTPENILKSSSAQQLGGEELLKEIANLKELLQKNRSSNGVPGSLPDPVERQLQQLRNQDLEQSLIDELTGMLLEKWYLTGSSANDSDIAKWSEDLLSDKLSTIAFGGISMKKKYVNVIGPTGVGKTTTLAKIAADAVLKHKKKVAFITTDTYRIAAIEQLKTYAKILGVPIEVCYNMEDFYAAKRKFDDFDLVFIDTAGRNFRNKKYVDDLKKAIDFNNDMETYLVLALTSKQKDMEEIHSQFSLIHIDQFIFTKVDETSIYGAMMNMAVKFSTGIAYITNGQDVPDDLIEANPTVIANTILGVSKYE